MFDLALWFISIQHWNSGTGLHREAGGRLVFSLCGRRHEIILVSQYKINGKMRKSETLIFTLKINPVVICLFANQTRPNVFKNSPEMYQAKG